MKLQQAKTIADALAEKLFPYSKQIAIAGSIRRQKLEVKDIEIVVIPDTITPKKRSSAWCKVVLELGQVLKGKVANGKYIKIQLPEGIILDLFIVNEHRNWGLMYLIRTGSAGFSRSIMVRLNKLGYTSIDGVVTHKETKEKEYFTTERELFGFLGMHYVQPEERRLELTQFIKL